VALGSGVPGRRAVNWPVPKTSAVHVDEKKRRETANMGDANRISKMSDQLRQRHGNGKFPAGRAHKERFSWKTRNETPTSGA
jgi:hypothetical protein